MDQQSREKYAVASYVIWSVTALIQNFLFSISKNVLTSPLGFALTSTALTKIKFVIPNTTRKKEYVWAWTARLWQSPSSTTTVPTVQTQHSLGYMSWPWILDRVVKMQWQSGKKMFLLLLLPMARNVWRQSEAAELSLPQASEHPGQYKHHLQSLQVVSPTYGQGVFQSHWLQIIQFLVITILETISRNEVCVRKMTKRGTTTTNKGNWGENNTFNVLLHWISILFE